MADGGFFKRFELVPGQHRPNRVRNGAISLGILALVLYAMFSASIPFIPKGGKVYTAAFSRADYLRPGTTQVRVGGVEVGRVEKVERQPDGDGALVSFRITDPTIQMKDDARATVYGRTLLGFFFEMDLMPGSASAPALADGKIIPETRTRYATDVDQALQPLDEYGRAGMRGFIKEAGTAFAGRAAHQTFDALGPASQEIAPGLDALQGQSQGDLGRLVTKTGSAMRALGRNETDLAGLLDNGATTFQAVGSQGAALSQAVQDGPETMDSVQVTMTRLRGTLDDLDPLARDLRPGARRLDEASREAQNTFNELDPMLERADKTFDDLDPAVRQLAAAADDGTPLMNRLQPTVDRTNESILPHLQQYDADTGLKDYEAIGPFFSAVGSLGAHFNEVAHSANFTLGLGEDLVGGGSPCNTFLVDPTADDKIKCDRLFSVFNQTLGAPSTAQAGTSSAGASIGVDDK
ncbi:MAG: phospholipid/cholesterol/gamma-HCH transport system substrate-binding protein [Thermoleophilaceae bacterium]|jgi:phospholipid/cholesterol/gamma-HCH transport system substrate-binding protein|nr:phospholipid/cholesterol/gamma-HCH transport system substrate-binding protein [Thermoleophilaceae bacterium]